PPCASGTNRDPGRRRCRASPSPALHEGRPSIRLLRFGLAWYLLSWERSHRDILRTGFSLSVTAPDSSVPPDLRDHPSLPLSIFHHPSLLRRSRLAIHREWICTLWV